MRYLVKLVPALAASSVLAACGSSSGGSPTPSASHSTGAGKATVVRTAPVSSLGGPVLADSRGLTLYHLSGERPGKWICTSAACVNAWHPLIAPAGAAPRGSVGSLGTVK